MYLKTLEIGMIATNCYLVACEETREAAVIDPGGQAQRILRVIQDDGLKVRYIINTHGHGDHIAANKAVKEATGADILIHELDGTMLVDIKRSLLAFMGDDAQPSPPADRLLVEGDIITIGSGIEFRVLHTPGHTPGGICLQSDKLVFTGDTLFAGSVGRTDFPGGSFDDMISSIKNKLLKLSDDYGVFPGHGPSSTIGFERRSNPFLR